jgi:hypothetical protein
MSHPANAAGKAEQKRAADDRVFDDFQRLNEMRSVGCVVNGRASASDQDSRIVAHGFAGAFEPQTDAAQGATGKNDERELCGGPEARDDVLIGQVAEEDEAGQENHDPDAHEPDAAEGQLERVGVVGGFRSFGRRGLGFWKFLRRLRQWNADRGWWDGGPRCGELGHRWLNGPRRFGDGLENGRDSHRLRRRFMFRRDLGGEPVDSFIDPPNEAADVVLRGSQGPDGVFVFLFHAQEAGMDARIDLIGKLNANIEQTN